MDKLIEVSDPLKGMTRKQRKFYSEYIKDYIPREAALRAGYSKKTASQIANELLNKEQGKLYIESIEKELAERNKITQDYFVTKLKDIIETRGEKTSDKLNALGLLAKLTGHLNDKGSTGAKQVVIFQQNSGEQPKEVVVTPEEKDGMIEMIIPESR